MRDRVAERRLKPGCPSAYAHIKRADAPRIHRALTDAMKLGGVADILAAARAEIAASPLARIDYLELVDAETLQPVTTLTRPAILAAAVYYGDVRLIDHVAVGALLATGPEPNQTGTE